MHRRLPAVAVAVAGAWILGCSIAAAPAASPSPSLFARATPVPIREPALLILGVADVGLPRTGGADHLSAGEAAHLEQNQPLSLTQYERWGWIDEATRDFGAAPSAIHLDLLLLSRDEGAELAYGAWQTGGAACPRGIAADDCSVDPGRQLVARVGPYVFRIATAGDAGPLAAKQAARIRSPSG